MPHDRRNEPDYGPGNFTIGLSRDFRRDPRHSPRRSPYRREEFLSGEGPGFYSDFERMGWGEEPQGERYFGTGSHYGGGYATAPGTYASSAGIHGAPGYAGQSAWSDRYSVDPESHASPSYGPRSAYARGFSGRGPKGYQRSDERIQELICDRLTDDPRIDASDITVEVRDHIVRLTGSVDDRRTKYEVEELVERCGVNEIDNQLRVQSNRWR
jgi:osmotically-inducible protein OsmY